MIGLYIAGISTVSLIGVLLVPKSVEGRDLNDADTGDITAPEEDPKTIQATV